MTNPREDREDIDLNELFDGINIDLMKKSFNEYILSLNSFFTKYTEDSSPSLMRFFEKFNPDGFSNDEVEFSNKALGMANYDHGALRGECVVLFSEPVIISDLLCTNTPTDENEGAIRLISYTRKEKKFTTKRTTHTSYTNKSILVTTYKVHDVVLGLILPRNCEFLSVKIAIYQSLLTDYNKLESAEKALQKASDTPRIEIQNIKNKLQNIEVEINHRREVFNTVQGDIQALEQEKSHTENSLKSSKVALEKARKDLENASREFNNLAGGVAQEIKTLEEVQVKVKSETSLYKKEHLKLEELQQESKAISESLMLTKKELADAKREQNATSFDTAGHTAETGKQLTSYYRFALLTFAGLISMAIYVYTNGQSFSETLPHLVHVSTWDILLSRLPLIAATTLIIGGLSGVFFFLIKHIVALNTEKMTMLKAGILAEQITNSLECKDMTEEHKLEFKRDTKIKLIMQVFSKSEPVTDKNNIIIEALKAMNSK
tara:strand:- start:604 stop:2076 length:1473 start_codon:yes stop_codon:yes gene_type:complete